MGEIENNEPTETAPPADVDTSAEDLEQQQSANEITEMFNELEEIEVKPDDEPAQDPEATDKDAQPAEAKDASADDKTPEKEPEAADAAADADTKKDDEEKDAEPDPLDTTMYDVVDNDQVRQVSARALVTTYQQFKSLQQRHQQIKPALDLLDSNKVPVNMVMPLLDLGIRTAYAQQTGQATLPNAGAQPYSGPFKDAAEDAKVKENDPVLHDSQWRVWNRQTPPVQQQQAAPQQVGPPPEAKQAFNTIVERINTWAGQHKGYFAPDPATGKSQKMDSFLSHIAKFYGQLSPDALDDTQLSLAFGTFDPKYVQKFMAQQAAEESKRLQAENRQMHSESGSVRDAAPVNLTEIQEDMADLMDPDALY